MGTLSAKRSGSAIFALTVQRSDAQPALGSGFERTTVRKHEDDSVVVAILALLAPLVGLLTAFAAAGIRDFLIKPLAWGKHLRRAVYLWPMGLIGVGLMVAFVWSPAAAHFPAPGYYSMAAQVIPVLLIALIVERDLIGALPPGLRLEFAAVFILAEAAAFVALSGSFNNSGLEELVGGSVWFTGTLATLTSTGLLAIVVLVVLAVMVQLQQEPATASKDDAGASASA